MGKTLDLGQRLEIHSLDRHCQSISIGLYGQRGVEGAEFLVHTYSAFPGASERIAFVRRAMEVLLGLAPVEGRPEWLRFPCGSEHTRAIKRAFLDVCRLPSDDALRPLPLSQLDKKAGVALTATARDGGAYRIVTEEENDATSGRTTALARGFVKVCEMEMVDESAREIRFPCGMGHGALLGFLMFRAQNVRGLMQELEASQARGMLAPPSQQ